MIKIKIWLSKDKNLTMKLTLKLLLDFSVNVLIAEGNLVKTKDHTHINIKMVQNKEMVHVKKDI